ncbi:hypothetical protein QAD02_019413 [Eretmocerus hayati]|uniref:Uncharacterized protein n=1 Tax=Eretmocerus hayati TaxID=131215 RepID=A0ACC2PLC4_9HYME|nr:hypothetical protein QAD02_019413 [Eretmocerus hayati]
MRKPRGLSSAALGLLVGLLAGLLIFQPRSPESTSSNTTTSYTSNFSALVATTSSSTKFPPTNLTSKIHKKEGLLFVGVMTAKKYLGSRARAVHESWGSDIPGSLSFYSSEDSRPPIDYPNLPLVALPKVDDSYPPQKKSFLMLQHMWREHGSDYEWFLRADDDLYVRMDRLEKLLRSIDSKKPLYIGQAGRGNSEEFGLLSLEYDENFCMGGPGVLLSRETLKRIVPHIKYCLSNLYTTHEDVELGRCVRKFAGISCTWSYEVRKLWLLLCFIWFCFILGCIV